LKRRKKDEGSYSRIRTERGFWGGPGDKGQRWKERTSSVPNKPKIPVLGETIAIKGYGKIEKSKTNALENERYSGMRGRRKDILRKVLEAVEESLGNSERGHPLGKKTSACAWGKLEREIIQVLKQAQLTTRR